MLPWRLHKLKSISRGRILHNMELRQDNVEYGSDGERMCNDVLVGDKIAFLCNDVLVGDNIVFLCNNNGDDEF